MTNRKASAIDYYCRLQLKADAAPLADVHFHPIESRSLRVAVVANFWTFLHGEIKCYVYNS